MRRLGARFGAASLPLALVAAVVVLLPLAAFVELPFERDVKGFFGSDYKPSGYCPVHDRGNFGAWIAEGRLPTPLEEGRAARLGDSAYIVGGFASPVVDNVVQSTPAFRSYDLESKRFTTLPPFPERLNHVGVAAYGGDLFAVGGLGDRVLSEPSDSLWRFDPERGEWRELAPMPTPRGALGVAVVEGTLYAIGGRTGAESLDVVEAYDIAGDEWSSRAPLPVEADHLGVAALGRYVYALGGRYDGGEELPDFRRYDPRRDRWESQPDLPMGTSGANLERIGNELVVTGGEDSEQKWVTGRTFAFNPAARRWRELPASPIPKHGYASVGYAGRLHVLGGTRCPGSVPVASIESLKVGAPGS